MLRCGLCRCTQLCVLCVPGILPPPPQTLLHTLRANGCNALRQVVIQLPHWALLRTLSLDSCRQLQSVVVTAPALESLVVSNCGQLHSLGLRCRYERGRDGVRSPVCRAVSARLLGWGVLAHSLGCAAFGRQQATPE